MNRFDLLLFFITTCSVFTSNDGAAENLTLRGRVTFPNGSPIPVEPNGILTVALQDTSLADAPARTIATSVGKAIRFPMAFAIKYSSSQIVNGLRYSLSVRITNEKNELLYINDVYTPVTPAGPSRSRCVNVSVIQVKRTTTPPAANKRQWPELVGTNGEEAVRIIKQETGFSNVLTVPAGSPVTLDYRTNRVRVFIDTKGNVKSIPTIG